MSEMTHAPFVLVPQHFGSTVFDRSNSRYYPFDAATTDLLVASHDTPFEATLAEIVDEDERQQALRNRAEIS